MLTPAAPSNVMLVVAVNPLDSVMAPLVDWRLMLDAEILFRPVSLIALFELIVTDIAVIGLLRFTEDPVEVRAMPPDAVMPAGLSALFVTTFIDPTVGMDDDNARAPAVVFCTSAVPVVPIDKLGVDVAMERKLPPPVELRLTDVGAVMVFNAAWLMFPDPAVVIATVVFALMFPPSDTPPLFAVVEIDTLLPDDKSLEVVTVSELDSAKLK